MAENKEEKKEVIENKETPKKETPKKEEVKKASPKEDKKFEPVKSSSETKKATNAAKPKAEKGKKTNIALRAIAVVVVLALVVGIIYIVLPSPARELQQMLKDLKAGNYDKVQQYVDYDKLIDSSVMSTDNAEQSKLFFEDLEFTVKEVKQEGDTAKITLETTNKDFKSIVQKAVTKLVQKYFSSENAEIENVLIEELQNENVEKVTTTQTITVQKQDGKWKVVVDDNLKNAIFPGLAETLETLTNGNMFSESE